MSIAQPGRFTGGHMDGPGNNLDHVFTAAQPDRQRARRGGPQPEDPLVAAHENRTTVG